jgi:hypothetical protein
LKLSALRRDPGVLEQGRWVDRIPGLPDVRLKVRPFGNPDDRRIQAAETEALPRLKRLRGELDAVDQDAIMNKRLVGAILVGWEGIENEAGEPLPYSAAEAERMIQDPDYGKLRDAVLWAVTVADEEEAEREAAARKN